MRSLYQRSGTVKGRALAVCLVVLLFVTDLCACHSKSEKSIEGLLEELGPGNYSELRLGFAIENSYRLHKKDYVNEIRKDGFSIENYLSFSNEAYYFAAREDDTGLLVGLVLQKQKNTLLKEYKYRNDDIWETVSFFGVYDGDYIAEQSCSGEAGVEKHRLGLLKENGTIIELLRYDLPERDDAFPSIRTLQIVGSKLLYEERNADVSLKAIDMETRVTELVHSDADKKTSYVVSPAVGEQPEGVLYTVLKEGNVALDPQGRVEQEEKSELLFFSFNSKKNYPALSSLGKHFYDPEKQEGGIEGEPYWKIAMGDLQTLFLYSPLDLFSGVNLLDKETVILDQYGNSPKPGDFSENELFDVHKANDGSYLVFTKWKVLKMYSSRNYSSFMIASDESDKPPFLHPERADANGKYVITVDPVIGSAFLYDLDQSKSLGSASASAEVRWNNKKAERIQAEIRELEDRKARLLLDLQALSLSEREANEERILSAIEEVDNELRALGVVFDAETGVPATGENPPVTSYREIARKHVEGLTESDVEAALDQIQKGFRAYRSFGGVIGDPGTLQEDGLRNFIMDPYDLETTFRVLEEYLSAGGSIPEKVLAVAVTVREEPDPFSDLKYDLIAFKTDGDWSFAGTLWTAFE